MTAAPALIAILACHPRSPVNESPGNDLAGAPPINLLASNVRATDITVVLRITRVAKVEEVGVYTTWKLDAEVVKTFKGDLSPGEEIQYHRTMETSFDPPEVGSRQLVGFVRKEERLMIPDAGYHFSSSTDLGWALEAELDAAG